MGRGRKKPIPGSEHSWTRSRVGPVTCAQCDENILVLLRTWSAPFPTFFPCPYAYCCIPHNTSGLMCPHVRLSCFIHRHTQCLATTWCYANSSHVSRLLLLPRIPLPSASESQPWLRSSVSQPTSLAAIWLVLRITYHMFSDWEHLFLTFAKDIGAQGVWKRRKSWKG